MATCLACGAACATVIRIGSQILVTGISFGTSRIVQISASTADRRGCGSITGNAIISIRTVANGTATALLALPATFADRGRL